jgi:methylated-DNA-[protein]-cysteine S-methyltransferase
MNLKPIISEAYYNSPIGWIRIRATGDEISDLVFIDGEPRIAYQPVEVTALAVNQLSEYFQGIRTTFDLPLCADGGEFDKRVWVRILQIPFGEVNTYSQVAESLGGLRYTRAVGLSNGRNPIPVFIPCHRVIGANGSLTGYGGGLWRKKWLLEHEAKVSGRPVQIDIFPEKQ